VKVRFLSVGKPKSTPAAALFDDYATRLKRFGVDVASDWVKESVGDGRFSAEHAMEREAQALLKALPGRGQVIALDRTGREIDSLELAGKIESWTRPEATFLIGGPLGFHSTIPVRADHLWSLSRLTFPHDLARTILAEQVYRAFTLVKNMPYHK
jgi:23S rRNA (pseudouridine1915-N3)-methyltransferase